MEWCEGLGFCSHIDGSDGRKKSSPRRFGRQRFGHFSSNRRFLSWLGFR